MGRQICFYIVQEDFDELLKVICKNGGRIIYEDGSIVDEKVLGNIMDENFRNRNYKYDTFYIKLDASRLFFDYAEKIKRKYIEHWQSDIIHFSFNMKDLKNGGEIYSRLYLNNNYYNENEELVYKLKDLDTFYNRVKRYITKNYIISEDKGYYIGPHCYELYLEGKYIPCNGRYRPVFRKKD
ncbi:Hypothetical protein CM240_0569 [Clostridium bornimense]|uniref:Uncharacterized protein n=1 Tax=Clostridium bornimense TaxID=1216932 RepID=W6RVU5_9CLOT|nr:hypothetical protein [Clostridium bornimense]CDM67734.1 Hypothetical protein CM240_0569 [Clostridium bornimense]